MKDKRPFTPLIERRIEDDNFPHTLSLLGACAAWAETVNDGQKLEWNDLNVIQSITSFFEFHPDNY